MQMKDLCHFLVSGNNYIDGLRANIIIQVYNVGAIAAEAFPSRPSTPVINVRRAPSCLPDQA